ncbi:hypothetical protein CesoFtcFv8_000410 [Champsocephalus esox]|uniref:Flavodoxin-like fold domain-containing protein n=1 Tax=Champsocephalus esox TaxID=159716 RepID=A0AAN8DEJ3_9TELE|nr:hypothetical protein CesoFtcFv8_000410 [Champsocephalus esox]
MCSHLNLVLASKKVLIVYAHQSSGSFNSAAKDAAVEVLTAKGCTVEVSDLYAMKFKATATSEDITGKKQRKLTEADLVIFQFPMYWFTVPAIMKGWMDRVLTLGFAFTHEKRYSQGIFKDKKAMLSFTTGSQESMFSANGINGDMNVTLWPLQNGILHYCGFQVLAPQIFWAPSHGYQLKPEVHEKHAAKEFGLTVGIHLGKALPPNNQMKAGV